jgi:hypothetical protein
MPQITACNMLNVLTIGSMICSVSTISSMLQWLNYQQNVTVSQLSAACAVLYIVSQLSAACYSVSAISSMLQCLNYQQHGTVSRLSAACYSVSTISNTLQCLNYQQHVTVSQLSATCLMSQLSAQVTCSDPEANRSN